MNQQQQQQTAETNSKIEESSNSSKHKHGPLKRSFTPLKQFSLSKFRPINSSVANVPFDFATSSLHYSMDNLKNLTANRMKFRKGNMFRRNVKTADVSSNINNEIDFVSRNNNGNNEQQQQVIFGYVNENEEKSEIQKTDQNQHKGSPQPYNKKTLLGSVGKSNNIQEDEISQTIPSGESLMKIEISSENTEKPSSNLNDGAFQIIWRNIIYYPLNVHVDETDSMDKNPTLKKQGSRKAILNNISGMFSSGQMTGIMGPSGSGKTVLLNCIAGFLPIHIRKENTGDILVNGLNSIRIGFVEQFDHLYDRLSVQETLLFASKIRNAARYYLNHEKVVNNVMERLDLGQMAETTVSKCSNGQRKRISIAIELVFKSDILMLDEPTTGVDSVSGYQIMRDLKSLTKRVSISINSNKIFSKFLNFYSEKQ